jgi:small neutral amino acid transporter SnatA (MarC family)
VTGGERTPLWGRRNYERRSPDSGQISPTTETMALQFTPYTVPVLVTLVVLAAVASYAYRVYRDDGSRVAFYLALVIALGFAWAVGTLVVLTATSRFWKLAATYEATVVTAFVPLVWVLFALAYADRWDLVTRRRLALFLVDPVVVTVTTLTNFEFGLM